MDLSQQAADLAGRGDLIGQVVVEAAEHSEPRNLLVCLLQRPQRVRHRPGSGGDDRRVASVGLRLTRVEVPEVTHRQSRQVGLHHRPERPPPPILLNKNHQRNPRQSRPSNDFEDTPRDSARPRWHHKRDAVSGDLR